jgi:RimJ/RimL family protein N-acetyltransferase
MAVGRGRVGHDWRMRLVLTGNVGEFSARAGGFLAQTLERNLLATVLAGVREGAFRDGAPLFAYGLDDQGDVVAAALRTPPWALVATGIEDPADASEFVTLWHAEQPELPGASGEPPAARAIAGAWSELTGVSSTCKRRMAMHALERVHPPDRPAAGGLEGATFAHRRTLIDWELAFREEAQTGAGSVEPIIDRRLEAGRQFVWTDEVPASTVAISPTVANVLRIGPVYTPPELRGRGYATSAVAAISERALRDGVQPMLFTDLSNPTSNRIYAAIGYRRFGDWEEHHFHA